MSVHQMSNNSLLTLYARVLDNSRRSPHIRDAVAVYGYDEEAFDEGEALLEVYREAVGEQVKRYGEKQSATTAVSEAWDALHEKTYMPHVIIARLAFRDDGVRRQLGIVGRRPDGFGDWVQEARHFYSVLLENEHLAAQMARRGIGRAKLEAALQDVEELEALDREQERLKAAAQDATRVRNTERRAAANWLSDYQKIAKIALAERPDLTEQLGLRAPS